MIKMFLIYMYIFEKYISSYGLYPLKNKLIIVSASNILIIFK